MSFYKVLKFSCFKAFQINYSIRSLLIKFAFQNNGSEKLPDFYSYLRMLSNLQLPFSDFLARSQMHIRIGEWRCCSDLDPSGKQ